MTETSVLDEWKSGWLLVVAAGFGIALGSVQVYSTGVFIQPLEEEFGWSRSAITGGMLISSIMGVLFSPLFGYLVDRWGARALAIPGVATLCAGYALLSLAGPAIWTWWALWFIIAVGSLMVKPTVWSTAISAHFVKGRGFALAVMLCGTGLGSAAIPPLSYTLIEAYGWRGAYLGIAAIFFVIVMPVIWRYFHDARMQKPDPDAAPRPAVTGWTAREGYRKRQFYQLVTAAFVITGVLVGFIVHILPMLEAGGLERETAVYIVGLTGVMSIVGRLTVGYLFDRLPGPPVGAVSVALPIPAAILLLMFPGDFAASVAAILFLGLAIGGEYDSVIYLSTRYFGMRAYGTLFGFVASGLLAGVGLGPIVAGAIYDSTGSYDLYLYLAIALAALVALLLATLGRYPDHE